MISIVIPLYNKAVQIGRTLESVFAQTYQDFEVVIVDDGSTDGSAEVVSAYSDPRIRLIRQENAGVSAARNRGIAEAKGDYIALIDADDEWKPEYLATQISLTEKYPECDVFCTDYICVDSKGKVTKTIINKLPFDEEDGILTNYFEVASCSNPPIWTSAVMLNKKAITSIGGFPLGIRSGEDLLTWARLACRYRIAYSRKALAKFNFDTDTFNEDQKNRHPEDKDRVGEELLNLYKSHHLKGQNEYIALWHKMRTRIFIDKLEKRKAIAESIKSMRYSINAKILAFFILSLLPLKASRIIINKIS